MYIVPQKDFYIVKYLLFLKYSILHFFIKKGIHFHTTKISKNIELFLLNFFVYTWFRVKVMVFNATFNNISVISWQSVLLVEETGVPQ
jgi:hypothetical protein